MKNKPCMYCQSLNQFHSNTCPYFKGKRNYQKIYKEGGFTLLTPEDMEWIDSNMKMDSEEERV